MEDIYLGNPLLKKANVAQEFTQEQILEFMACKQDPVYFAKQHVRLLVWMKVLFHLNLMIFRKD